jgi:hypothetical protein
MSREDGLPGKWPSQKGKGRNPNGYPKNWDQIKRIIKERDEFACRLCGEDGGTLHVHHIDYNVRHNRPDNLVTLCIRCHGVLHYSGYIPDGDQWPIPWGKHPPIDLDIDLGIF